MDLDNRYLRTLLDGSADAIIGLDERDVVRFWNRGAERMFSYGADEMIGRSIDGIIPEERLRNDEPAREKEVLLKEGSLCGYETERVAKDGRRINVSLTRSLLRDPEGRPIGSSLIIRDVTEKRRLDRHKARAESQAAMSEILAGLAHEVRNPLAGVRGAVQIIEDGLSSDDPRREVVREIKGQIERMDRTLSDILLFSRPKPPELSPRQVNLLLSEAVSLLRRDPRLGAVLVEEALALDVPPVMLDAQQMQRVFFNVLLNAVQAMPTGGRLRVTSRRNGASVEIAFEDEGVGMSPEVTERVFRPFFTTKRSGTGVGLSVSQGIVEAHGGRIAVESVPGRGSIFTIVLPVPRTS
jgi:PAS domain S-box-containing protein